MKVLLKIAKFVLFPVTIVAGLFLVMICWFYISCPVYSFDEPKPFYGEIFYNPYQAIKDDAWKKCIFHLHTKSWLGLTNGDNNYEEIIDAYKKFNYDVIAISDYMKINQNKSNTLPYIPVYEHGYNVKKVHQLALGAKKVVWRDYFFSQNLNQKQHLIDILKKHSRLVAVNHPSMRNSYLPKDFKYLSGYDLFEVLNGTHISEIAWDAALSSGRPAWLIANDDAHSIQPKRLQREVTFVNDESNDVLNNLSKGVAFGVHFPRNEQTSMTQKMNEANVVSFPENINIQCDTLNIIWQQTMKKIEFIGDNGRLLKTIFDNNVAFYIIQPEDSYVRIKLTSHDGLVYFLNPVVRNEHNKPVMQTVSRIDTFKTFWKRTIISTIASVFLLILAIHYFHLKKLKIWCRRNK